MNSHLHHQCSSVDLAISRQVGVKSPLHCSPAAFNNNKNVKTNACDSVQAAISRQVGINSPLYCEACSAAARPAPPLCSALLTDRGTPGPPTDRPQLLLDGGLCWLREACLA